MFNKVLGNSIIFTNSYNKNYLIKLISNINKLVFVTFEVFDNINNSV